MPVAAVIAAALTDHSAHPWGLWLGGLDVTKEPGGSGYGTSADSIEVTEAGPGAVSSMTFEVDDPFKELGVNAGNEVAYFDLVNDVCLFRGWVDHYDSRPAFGGQGRVFRIECTGLEAILDWSIVAPGASLGQSNRVPGCIGMLAQQYAPKLKAPSAASGMGSAPWTRNGSFDYPVGNFLRTVEPILPLQWGGTSAGGTLRNAVSEVIALGVWFYNVGGGASTEPFKALVTVDFYYGLRIWEDDDSLQPDDYTTLTVTDTYAGPNRAAGLAAQVDWAGVVRSVMVVGSGGTNYGVFGDGSGIYGPQTLITDSNVTTADLASQRAMAYLAQQSASVRGSFTLEDWTPPTTVHAGSLVSITDAATSVATTYRISEIRKRFNSSGRQDWTVSFGGLQKASGARLMRRLTRATLN